MRYRFLILLILFATPAQASLFFSVDEKAQINALIQKNRSEDQAKHLIHFSSLLYFGPTRWTIWLHGRKWTPQTKDKHIKINEVTKSGVSLTIKHPALTGIRHVTLCPHQSFSLLTGQVIEGF
jgi:hypothetical protein